MDEGLYREIILDHYQNPRHKGCCGTANCRAHGHNPLCGDDITITAHIEQGRVKCLCFDGKGCSISQSSASMMTEAISGLTIRDAIKEVHKIKAMFKGEEHEAIDEDSDLATLEGVKKFPVRIKCALLPWTTLEEALEESDETG